MNRTRFLYIGFALTIFALLLTMLAKENDSGHLPDKAVLPVTRSQEDRSVEMILDEPENVRTWFPDKIGNWPDWISLEVPETEQMVPHTEDAGIILHHIYVKSATSAISEEELRRMALTSSELFHRYYSVSGARKAPRKSSDIELQRKVINDIGPSVTGEELDLQLQDLEMNKAIVSHLNSRFEGRPVLRIYFSWSFYFYQNWLDTEQDG